MEGYRDPGIKLSLPFEPGKLNPLQHELHRHPLLQLPKLLELGKRLDKVNGVRRHSDQAKESTSFHYAPDESPTDISVEKALGNLENAHVWMSLLNVHAYDGRKVVRAMGSTSPHRERSRRSIWDNENSFLFHITGEKKFYTWDPADREVLSEEALELFHGEYRRDRAKYQESFLERARAFDFKPGEGVFVPLTAPHMVRNGNAASISMCCTYYTDRSRRLQRIYRSNHCLRALGMRPRPVGEAPWVDTAKAAAMNLLQRGKRAARVIRGTDSKSDEVPYAMPY